jgi:hypothetical protein
MKHNNAKSFNKNIIMHFNINNLIKQQFDKKNSKQQGYIFQS